MGPFNRLIERPFGLRHEPKVTFGFSADQKTVELNGLFGLLLRRGDRHFSTDGMRVNETEASAEHSLGKRCPTVIARVMVTEHKKPIVLHYPVTFAEYATELFCKRRRIAVLNLLLMTVIAFIVGLSISGQTFYTFILENLEKFGALKAIGAKGRELVYMILFMATFTALTGYGLGVGLVTLMISIARYRLPNYAAMVTFGNLGMAFGMVVLIAGISSYIGIRKVLKIEPFDIFRG